MSVKVCPICEWKKMIVPPYPRGKQTKICDSCQEKRRLLRKIEG